ncbi:MAG: ABC transporter ATP-binding protein [Bacteroidales bacterium]|nr:MAG: ABC transporter ATP-binding protein [Bacteroidales bacterium]
MNENRTILKTRNLEIGYAGKRRRPVFSNINLVAGEAEIIALVGQNGIGKSTLLRSLTRLQKSLSGDIFIYNKNLEEYGRLELAKTIGFVSTEIVHISNLTIFDLVGLGRFPHTNWLGRMRENDIRSVRNAINLVGLKHLAYNNINEVSDGERQRAMIARTLAQDTSLMILDEPTAFLDLPSKYEIIHILTELSRTKERTIIFSTHDLNIAMQEADMIWLMLPDRIMSGSPEDLVLDNSFSNIFANSKLHFDSDTGDFRMKRRPAENIYLYGKGKSLYWTQRALERLGYNLTDNRNSETAIRLEEEAGKRTWILQKKEKILKLKSIYELSLHLKK